jgi:hypothetical protein
MTDPTVTLPPASLTEHLVEGRECGSCTACCKVFQIPELNKPRYVLCSHCTGSQCGIYETRPKVCREYYCLWRRIEVMPDFARPDKLGIMFSVEMYAQPRMPFEKMYIIGRAPDNPAAFDTPEGRAAVNMFVREGSLPVFIAYEHERKMIYPNKEFSEAILDPANTTHRSLVPAALKWRKQYGMT